MKAADVKEWLNSPVTEAYFKYLGERIAAFKTSRGEGALLSEDPHKMFRANWELVGGLKELEALRDLPVDQEQVFEVFGVSDEV
jgi:hypothetical protein